MRGSAIVGGAAVIDLELSWHQAAATAGVLAVGTVVLRRARRPRLRATSVFMQETALVLALFALWQFAGSFAVVGPGGALSRSRWIWHFERVVYLPSETTLQGWFLPHPLLVQFFNLYYDSLHFPVLIACMVWLFVRHRDSYRRLRTTLVALTGACLVVQLIPVAPPRMLTGTGLVDTAVLYHQSVYATSVGFKPDELSAMPSVHVGWAVLVAVAVIMTLRSRWRWLALLYPAMTTLAVVVTANHFWLDGIVAAGLLGLVLLVQAAGRRALVADWGLYPERPTWHDPDNIAPTSIRGNDGDISARSGSPRAAAERDRAT
jgi:PAP2 superfamily